MKKYKYSDGFERFWLVWKAITKAEQGKPMAYKYWRRDRLEKDADVLIEILTKQARKRKEDKANNYWVPRWCWAQKWLNERRYEYVPEEPEKEQQKPPEPEEPFVPADPEKVAEGKKKMYRAIKPAYYGIKSTAKREARIQRDRKRLLGTD
jgi:hypothetical protein